MHQYTPTVNDDLDPGDLHARLDPEYRPPTDHVALDGEPHLTFEELDRYLADLWLAEREEVRE